MDYDTRVVSKIRYVKILKENIEGLTNIKIIKDDTKGIYIYTVSSEIEINDKNAKTKGFIKDKTELDKDVESFRNKIKSSIDKKEKYGDCIVDLKEIIDVYYKKQRNNNYNIVVVEIKDYKIKNYKEFRRVFENNKDKIRLDDFYFKTITKENYESNLCIDNDKIYTIDKDGNIIKTYKELPPKKDIYI